MSKKNMLFVLISVLILTILPQFSLAGEKNKDISKSYKHIFVIIVDGLQEDHLNAVPVPNIKGLMKNGMTAQRVLGKDQPVINIISSLSTGLSTGDADPMHDRGPASPSSHDNKIIFIDGTGGQFADLVDDTGLVKSVVTGPQDAIQTALKSIDPHASIFCTIILHQSDPKNLSTVDNQIGFLLNHLRKTGMINNSLLAVTGTTGNPPVVICDPQIIGGINLPVISFADMGATIRFLNGQKATGNGMILYECLEPSDQKCYECLLRQRIKDLSSAYAHLAGVIEQNQQEKKDVEHQQATLNAEKAKYTTVIKEQQKEINRLRFRINFTKFAGWAIFVLFITALYLEYRFLKKRFMFFT